LLALFRDHLFASRRPNLTDFTNIISPQKTRS
jgi:hypothetical protein